MHPWHHTQPCGPWDLSANLRWHVGTPNQGLPEFSRKCWTSVILSFWPYRSQDISKVYVVNSFKLRKAFFFFFPVQTQGSVNKARVRCFIFSHKAFCGPPLPIVLISSPLHRASLRLSPPGWGVIYKALWLARDIRQHQRWDFRTICKICFGSFVNSGSRTRKTQDQNFLLHLSSS